MSNIMIKQKEEMRTFDIKRFWLTAVWDITANRRMWLKLTAGLAVGLFLGFEMNQSGLRGHDCSEAVILLHTQRMAAFAQVVLFFLLSIGGTFIFSNIRSRQQRMAFFMLPASAAEKFMVRYVAVTVGLAVAFVVALAVADLLRWLLDQLLGPADMRSVFCAFFAKSSSGVQAVIAGSLRSGFADSRLVVACLMAFLVWLHSLYLLGGVFFRRNPWLFTTISMIICLYLLAAGRVGRLLPALNGHYDVWFAVVTAIFALLTVADYRLAFRLFRRMQVVNNKWVNVW